MAYRPAVRSLPNERPEIPGKSFMNGICVYKLRLALVHFGFTRLLTRLSSQFILLNQKRSPLLTQPLLTHYGLSSTCFSLFNYP